MDKESWAGGEHRSRYIGVMDEFPITVAGRETRFSNALRLVESSEELSSLIKASAEAAVAYANKEFDRYIAEDDGGAAQFMGSFAKWSCRYLREVAEAANEQLPPDHQLSYQDLGVSRNAELAIQADIAIKAKNSSMLR